jgi:trk system potassium uptake protein TrkA
MMKIIIMGCGRVGEQAARFLSDEGHNVSVIDQDADALERLGVNFKGIKIKGVGFDKHVLINAGIEHADAFAATSSSDNANIVAARIARNIFHVPHVITRLYDPRRAEIYRRLGLVTISSTTWGAERICELISHAELDPVFTFGSGEVNLVAVELPPQLVGRQVRDLSIPGEIVVVNITRQGMAMLPLSGTEFRDEDLLHLAVSAQAMDRVKSLLGMGEGG